MWSSHPCPSGPEREAEVSGSIPSWLRGTLLRNGPGQFEVGSCSFRHWFDGLAQLHRFHIADGRVRYSSRPLDSRTYQLDTAERRIVASEFGTARSDDPCQSLFGRFFSKFAPSRSDDNCNISLASYGDSVLALQERRHGLHVDVGTLETKGKALLGDGISGQTTTAHPHYSADGRTMYNLTTTFSAKSYYTFYQQPNPAHDTAAAAAKPTKLASIAVSQPSYLHSFGMSEHFFILAEWPFVTHPAKVGLMNVYKRSYAECFHWQTAGHSTWHVVDKQSGQLVARYHAPACFAFHHINAYEERSPSSDSSEALLLHVDIVAYADSSIIDALYLDNLRHQSQPVPRSDVRRYSLPIPSPSKAPFSSAAQPALVQPRIVWPYQLELPRINYRRISGRQYSFCYGLGHNDEEAGEQQQAVDGASEAVLFSRLVKLNVQDGSRQQWSQPGCHPSEPLFVARPDGTAEDDGVVLSVVLQPASHCSFLLLLDAASFNELGRAAVSTLLPVGLHGIYVSDKTD